MDLQEEKLGKVKILITVVCKIGMKTGIGFGVSKKRILALK